MRVRISTNPPLPPVKAWFPLDLEPLNSILNISNFKTTLCSSIPAFRGIPPDSLRLSIDGFELLDTSTLSIVRDGDLIWVDALDVTTRDVSQMTESLLGISRKRKRCMSSSSESETDSETETETSDSEPESDESSRPSVPVNKTDARTVQPRPQVAQASASVPPGYGKPQTRARNLRRRKKRMHERAVADVSEGGPVSGSNAQVRGTNSETTVRTASQDEQSIAALRSLSLRNKNKARNFKSLMSRPLPPKIIFGDGEEGESVTATRDGDSDKPQVRPRLIPPSSRSSLPPNMFVTSVDVEANLHKERRKEQTRVEYGHEPEEQTDGEADVGVEEDIERLESVADKQWDTLAVSTRERPGTIVGYKGLGINPVTYTPEQVVTVARVESCDAGGLVVRPVRGVSFGGALDGPAEAERCTWDEMARADWRVLE